MTTITGKKVGPIGYGMMNLTWRETPIPDPQAFATMKAALAAGCNFWNAGIFYGSREANSLQLLHRYFSAYPEDADKVVLSIKGGQDASGFRPLGTRENLCKDLDECLKVLDGVKFIDVFEQARQDPNVPVEESMSALAEYAQAGKIGGIGISEVSSEQIRAISKVHPIAAVEVEVSLQTPDILTNGVALTCAELNIPIVGYSPLGRGLLTANISKPSDLDPKDIRHMLPRFSKENMEQNAKLGDEVKKIADKKGVTPAQVAIAWVTSIASRKGMPEMVAIPGSTTSARVTENGTVVELSEEEVQELDAVRQRTNITGDRYPSH